MTDNSDLKVDSALTVVYIQFRQLKRFKTPYKLLLQL